MLQYRGRKEVAYPMKQALLYPFQGFCMALADSVPGVSGGTIALIMGFYEPFVGALHSLFGKDPQRRKRAFFYLCRLGVGWGTGLLLSILALSRLFESNIYFLSSLFLGLTAGAIPLLLRRESWCMKGAWWHKLFTALGCGLVCALFSVSESAELMGHFNYTALEPAQYIYLFISGALAIVSMVLPGISGSTLLLILGVYLPTVYAIGELLRGTVSVLPGLCVLAAGAVLGAMGSVRMIRAALRRYRGQMIYLILGLMLGSLFAIVLGPTTLDPPKAPLQWESFEALGFLIGLAILLGLERLKKSILRERQKDDDRINPLV